jgi:hypothetical protein
MVILDRSPSREGEARAHLLPRPGRTRLPRPVRVRSWGGWVRNGIKVYNFHAAPTVRVHPAALTFGYTRLPRPVRVCLWAGGLG